MIDPSALQFGAEEIILVNTRCHGGLQESSEVKDRMPDASQFLVLFRFEVFGTPEAVLKM